MCGTCTSARFAKKRPYGGSAEIDSNAFGGRGFTQTLQYPDPSLGLATAPAPSENGFDAQAT